MHIMYFDFDPKFLSKSRMNSNFLTHPLNFIRTDVAMRRSRTTLSAKLNGGAAKRVLRYLSFGRQTATNFVEPFIKPARQICTN